MAQTALAHFQVSHAHSNTQTKHALLDELENRYITNAHGEVVCPALDNSHGSGNIVVHIEQASARALPAAAQRQLACTACFCAFAAYSGLRTVRRRCRTQMHTATESLEAQVGPKPLSITPPLRQLCTPQVAGLWYIVGASVLVGLSMVAFSKLRERLRHAAAGGGDGGDGGAEGAGGAFMRRKPRVSSFWGTTLSFNGGRKLSSVPL